MTFFLAFAEGIQSFVGMFVLPFGGGGYKWATLDPPPIVRGQRVQYGHSPLPLVWGHIAQI